jgi:membrane associated rhomboid family serine protease
MTSTYEAALRRGGNEAKRLLRPLLILVAVAWLIEIMDRLFFSRALDQLGITPRQLSGLRGILFAPFLHGSFAHLLANTVPFLILGFLVMMRRPRRFVAISLVILAISGLGTWLIAPDYTVHIGASGLIFGYFAFLVVNAWFERSFSAVLLALLVVVLYGGLITGIWPAGGGISWQGHLFGLLGGAVAAFYFSPRRVELTR